MICFRSTTSLARPALIRPVSRSPNAPAALLSMRPLISRIVTSPARCSAISTPRLPQSLAYSDDVEFSLAGVVQLIHQCLDEKNPQSPRRPRVQLPIGNDKLRTAWIERFAIVGDFRGQYAVLHRQFYTYLMCIAVVIAIRDDVVEQFVEAEIEGVADFPRDAVRGAEPIDEFHHLGHVSDGIGDHDDILLGRIGEAHAGMSAGGIALGLHN